MGANAVEVSGVGGTGVVARVGVDTVCDADRGWGRGVAIRGGTGRWDGVVPGEEEMWDWPE